MNELLSTGIEVMLLGMGIVYSFLAMLVLAIKVMSSLVTRYFPEIPGAHFASGQAGDDPGTIAAITAAVHQYRKKHSKHD
jgi:oxaloacetate decarboxylase gamma subunit